MLEQIAGVEPIRLLGETIRIEMHNGALSLHTPQGTIEYNHSLTTDPEAYITDQFGVHSARSEKVGIQLSGYPPNPTWGSNFVRVVDNIRAAFGMPIHLIQSQESRYLRLLEEFHYTGAIILQRSFPSDRLAAQVESLANQARALSVLYSEMYLRSREVA